MTTFRKFNSIVQYSGVVKAVRDHCSYNNLPLPVLTFTGSTKLHGSNAAVGFSKDGDIWFQSRERVLTTDYDNSGFCNWGICKLPELKQIYEKIAAHYQIEHDNFYIYGEWFGKGVAKGTTTAIATLTEKRLGIFEFVFVLDGKETKINALGEWHYEINQLLSNVVVINYISPPRTLTIDFSYPAMSQNTLLEMTLETEAACPAGKYFGAIGVGEGIVWSAADPAYTWVPKFKTKGEQHSVSKVTTLRELTEAELTVRANAKEFVEFACTENRLMQGIAKLEEMGLPIAMPSMSAYLKWVGNDILTEHGDSLAVSMLTRKDVMPHVADISKSWFMEYIGKTLGITTNAIIR